MFALCERGQQAPEYASCHLESRRIPKQQAALAVAERLRKIKIEDVVFKNLSLREPLRRAQPAQPSRRDAAPARIQADADETALASLPDAFQETGGGVAHASPQLDHQVGLEFKYQCGQLRPLIQREFAWAFHRGLYFFDSGSHLSQAVTLVPESLCWRKRCIAGRRQYLQLPILLQPPLHPRNFHALAFKFGHFKRHGSQSLELHGNLL